MYVWVCKKVSAFDPEDVSLAFVIAESSEGALDAVKRVAPYGVWNAQNVGKIDAVEGGYTGLLAWK